MYEKLEKQLQVLVPYSARSLKIAKRHHFQYHLFLMGGVWEEAEGCGGRQGKLQFLDQ